MMMMMATWQTTLHWMYKRLALYLANLTHADHGIVLSQLIFLICLSWPSYHYFHSQCLYVDTIILHQDSTFFLYSLTFCNISANQCCQSFIGVNYAKCKFHTIQFLARILMPLGFGRTQNIKSPKCVSYNWAWKQLSARTYWDGDEIKSLNAPIVAPE